MRENYSHSGFQKQKITTLNRFFMKNIICGSLLALAIFIISIVMLIILLENSALESSIKISIISMIATFILTTSKSLIDKIITIIQFLITLLSEEQRGLNKNIGIDMEKVELEPKMDEN